MGVASALGAGAALSAASRRRGVGLGRSAGGCRRSSPSPARIAIGAPTFTPSVPSGTRILAIVPSSTASNSIVALSVSISARMSPDFTLSPSFTSHLASVPSSIVGESAGILSSMGMSGVSVKRLARLKANAAVAVKAAPNSRVARLHLSRGLTQHSRLHGGRDRNAPIWSSIDDSAEARVALRFAARRAAKTERPDRSARDRRAAGLRPVRRRAGGDRGRAAPAHRRRGQRRDRRNPRRVRSRGEHHRPPGRSRCRTVREYHRRRARMSPRWCSAPRRAAIPGPLVANFTGTDAGKLPCPVMIIPGSLSDERLEQLS